MRLMLNKGFKIGTAKSLFWLSVLLVVGSSLAQQITTETAQSFETVIGNTFFIDSYSNDNNLSVGLIHLQPQNSNILFADDTRTDSAQVSITNLTTDTWGYAEKGFEISVDSKSNPYSSNAINDTSTDLWLSTRFFQSVDSLIGISLSNNLGLSGFTEFSLEATFNPSVLTTTDSTNDLDANALFSALGSFGYRQSFDTNLPLGTNLVTIDRISVEPKVRAWLDSDFTLGANADLSIRADTSISDFSNLSLGLEGGYTNGFWYNFTVNSPIKF